MRGGWVAIALCSGASFVSAQPLPDTLRACAAEPDSARRLACYDKEVGRLAQPPTARNTSPSTASSAAEISPAEEFGLGAERVRKLKEKEGVKVAPELSALPAHVTAISQLPYGRLIITLDNAQVWEQTETDPRFALKSGASVTITRGALGSFWLASDARHATRVKRLR